MFKTIVISIGLVLVIEGVMYFFLANKLNYLIQLLEKINPRKIKSISLTSVFFGLCLIYFTLI